ncbi:beta-lactamase family protein [Paenibacillus tritici]|uniref:serine hydrolase domain-containing protein n=1 Tax=Paenibacillus tritici TaxID=1873425 RepID=UPI001BADC740|nr:serine hydrolase domain-containing protein [Paenibacillus tritici]QUL53281.1 beta-lactamase family protein [Paenibacillus tritici]
MNKLTSVVLAAMLVIPAAQASAAQEKQNPVQAKARELASKIVADYGVSGMQYAIMDKGNITLSGGAGFYDTVTKAPITKDTMFGIGSVSKMYVSAATMILAEDKVIDIDKPLITYLPQFKMADERYKEITPRMLMNHSSGLYGSHYGNSILLDDNDTQNHDEMLSRMASERLKSDPGEYSVYCNDGFQLLELMIEQVSGISYSEFLDRHFSSPMKVSSTKTPLDSFDRQQLAKTYFPSLKPALPAENANILGAGGLYSTAEDLTKFAEVLNGNYPDILSKASAEAMRQPEYKNGIWVPEERNSFNYGLGWDAVDLAPFGDYGIKALTKGGDTIMYHAALTTLPESDISIAVLSSGGSSVYNTVFASQVLLEYLKDTGKIQKIQPDQTFTPPVKAAMPAEMQSYSGLYGTVGATLPITVKGGELTLPVLAGLIPAQKYVYTGKGQFKNSDGSAAVSFEKQKNGITYLKLDAHLNIPGIGQMPMVTYEYQKLEANPLNASTKQAWEKRNGKHYYAVDEKISSLFYLSPSILTKTIAVEQGYATGTKIVDGNTAVNAAEIPVMNGRDAFDLNFSTKNGQEYLTIDGNDYISEDAVKPLYGGRASISTVPASGQAVWMKLDKKSAGRTMTVTAPSTGGYAVYDADGVIVSHSMVGKDPSVVLPQGGMAVFGGKAGDVFKIHLQ